MTYIQIISGYIQIT